MKTYQQRIKATKKDHDACSLCLRDTEALPAQGFYCSSKDCQTENKKIDSTKDTFILGDCAQAICGDCYEKGVEMGTVLLQNRQAAEPESFRLFVKDREGRSEEKIQCSTCHRKQHYRCADLNYRKAGLADYVCLECHINFTTASTTTAAAQKGYTKTEGLRIKDIKETALSRRIQEEVREIHINVGGRGDEPLWVRELSHVKKTVSLSNPLYEYLASETPEISRDFPYTQRCLVLGQTVDQMDIFLFCMYVQEYDQHCPPPNTNSVSISMVDSLNYYRPRGIGRRQVYQQVCLCVGVVLDKSIFYISWAKFAILYIYR